MIFYGEVINGVVKLFHTDIWKEFLKSVEGKKIQLDASTRKETRTSRQHRYLFVYYTEISEVSGYSKAELHAFFKRKFLVPEYVQVYGEMIAVEPSTKKLSKAEFSEYIIRIHDFTGITPPEPEHFSLKM